MKKQLLLIATLFFSVGNLFAQTNYSIDDVDGQTINTCDANFYDSGGFAENC